MTLDVETMGAPEPRADSRLRVAAAGDIHVSAAHRDETVAKFGALAGQADLLLLAGDLSTHGEPAQAEILAEACAQIDLPVVAVLGNHDWHAGRADEFTEALRAGGVVVLERAWTTLEVAGLDVGIVGTKGFVGGFPGSHLPDFGEPLLRQVYAETTAEVEALHEGLRAIALCPFRLVVLHYAPTAETLRGEREAIYAFLGCDRLAAPIAEHEPDLVVHGHAHAGCFEGRIGEVPVFNVSVPVLGRDFWVFELTAATRPASPIH